MRVHNIFASTKYFKILLKFTGIRDKTVIGVIYFETAYRLSTSKIFVLLYAWDLCFGLLISRGQGFRVDLLIGAVSCVWNRLTDCLSWYCWLVLCELDFG